MKRILVTGAGGQLGQCIKELSPNIKATVDFFFVDSKTLDITNKESINNIFKEHKITHCINCAAYTAVDNAETEIEKANEVNVLGAKFLAEVCKINHSVLIHVSTDFVFDGNAYLPYKEEMMPNPKSVYGMTKLEGEQEIVSILKEHIIIRTSWLYSEYGNNFVKTMLKLSQNRDKLTVISDQIGTPTYAKDLASAIIKFVTHNDPVYGLYHYSNQGVASWYDFAKAIFEIKNIKINVLPIPTTSYPTPAKRPHFSVLDKRKVENALQIDIPYWRDSLKNCLSKLP